MQAESDREEFESHGLHNVHTQHRNVCKDGFGEVVGVEAGRSKCSWVMIDLSTLTR